MSVTQPGNETPAAGGSGTRSLAPLNLGIGFIGPLAGLGVWLASGAPLPLVTSAAVIWIAIFLWASALVPEYITALILFFLAVLTQIAPPSVVFSGFHSTAVWLVFGGLVLGLSVQQSGLAARAVAMALRKVRTSYRSLIWSLAVVGLLLAFVVPSAMGRVMIMIPIVLALADSVGFAPGSRGRTGMVLAIALGTMMPAFGILPSNVPNMAMMGAAATIYGLEFQYGDFFLLNFTVMGALSFLAIPIVITSVYSETPTAPPQEQALGGWTAPERRLLIYLGVTTFFWATDFIHGVSPAWVALGAAIMCLAPRVGVIEASSLTRLNFGPWIFVAGVIGLGAIASHSGLGDKVGNAMVAALDLGGLDTWQQFAAITVMGMVTGAVTSLPAAPAIMTPLADALAQTTGWSLEGVLMAQVPTWLIFLFPYQAPPIVVALALGAVRMTEAMPAMVRLFAFGVVVILPLQFLWMRFLEYVP